MAQGAAHIPISPKASATKGVPAPAPSAGTISSVVARPQIPATAAKPAAVKPVAPAAPKAQPRPAPAPAPAAVAPAPPVRKAFPSLVDNLDSIPTRVAPAPVVEAVKPAPVAAVVKPAAVTAAVKPAQPPAVQLELRALIDASIAPLEQTVRDLQRRIEDLELRSLRSAPALAPSPTFAQAPARAPILDIATIERTVTLGPEMNALDGRRRRRRLLIGSILAVVVVFGTLFATLAQSYTHAHP